MQVEVATLIGSVVGISGMVVGILGYIRGGKKIDQDSNGAMVSLQVDLKYMKNQLGSIDEKLSKLEEGVSNVHISLAKTSERIDTLFRIYEELKARVDKLERRN